MGQKASTGAYSGFLEGVSVPPPPGVILPAPPQRPVKVTIPQPKSERQKPLKPGDTFTVKLSDERKCQVRVPPGAVPGQQVQMLLPEHHKMVASTLHAPPVGFKILAQKPIVVANISYQIQGPTKEQASSQQVASLMQAAQNELLRQAHAASCNAVLGIGFSVTTTSSGLPGQTATTLAMVSAFGTPCTVAKDPSFSLPGLPPPVAQADPSALASSGVSGAELCVARTDSSSSLQTSEVAPTTEPVKGEESSKEVAQVESRPDNDDDDEFADAEAEATEVRESDIEATS